MKTSTIDPTSVISRWLRFFGAMLIVALMVPTAAFSQPAAPVLGTPANNATGQPQAPTLIWNASTGVGTVTYHLQIAADIGFTTGVIDFTALTTTSQLITGLAFNTDYYWRVLAHDDVGDGSYSTPSKFTTWAAIPSPGPLPVTLGNTAMFAILSYTGITSNGTASAVTGDIGVSPTTGSSITLATTEVTGIIYTVDATGPATRVISPTLLTAAMGDLTTAYNDAAGRTVNPIGLAGNLAGQTLYPGLYKSTSSLSVASGDVTLNANGDATSVWIFQISSGFNMTNGNVVLTNGAKASNIFWQVGSAATFVGACTMNGTVMAHTSITMTDGDALNGRALAQTGNVTLIHNAVTNPGTVNLKSAVTFGVLSADGISGTGTVSGNVGTAAGTIGSVTATTGYTVYSPGDAAVTTALTDLNTAYTNAAGRTADAVLSVTIYDLGSNTKTPGVYEIGTDAAMTGTLTLNGAGIYIFQIGGNLTTATNSIVSLTNGAQWSDVFWQVGSSATLGTNSAFEGTIMANTSIQVNSGATMSARLLAGAVSATGAVALNGNTVLPVELVSFTATANGMNSNLHWSTATEINNSGFEIQRRQTSDWAKVGFVAGAGTSNAPRNYSYTDSKLSAGSYSYRLKQIDNNGAFTYGSTVEVAISSAPAAFALSQNYPNPFNPSTVISYSLEKAGMVSLRVYNMLGQEVATLVNGPQEAGVYTVSFNTSKGTLGLSSGVYVYRLEAGSFISTKKLVLMK
jgi:hypothetical protein